MIGLFERIKNYYIISANLLFTYITHQSKWWLKDKRFIKVAQAINSIVVAPAEKQTSNADISILKQNDRKIIFRIFDPLIQEESYVAKVCYLIKLRHMLKYYRYGLDEAVNLIMASKRGLPVPEVHGYGHIYNRFGLVSASIVIMEDLRDLLPLNELLKKNHDDEYACSLILMRTVPLFVNLYKAHCNHIDVNGGAIMLSENSDSKVCILDFQYARFMNKPSTEVLMAQAGRLSKTFKDYISEKIISNWLENILSAINISSEEEKKRLFLRFQYYRTITSELSRKERKNIK